MSFKMKLFRSIKSLSVFHCNSVCILYRFWEVQHQRMAWPWRLS